MCRTKNLFILVLAFSVFFGVKLSNLYSHNEVLNAPRTGDDALVYLWKAKYSTLNYDESLQAIANIKNQAALDLDADINKYWANRVLMRAIGSVTPLTDVIFAKIFSYIDSLKTQFFVMETIILVFFGLSIITFLAVLFNPQSAALATILLSTAPMPDRDIYLYYSPSILAISMGLFLWSYLYKYQRTGRIYWIFLLSLATLLTHPIGTIFVITSIGIYGISRWQNNLKHTIQSINATDIVLIMSIISAYILKIICFKIGIFTPLAPTVVTGFININAGIDYNLATALKILYHRMISNWMISIPALLGIIYYIKQGKNIRILMIIAFWILVLITAISYYVPQTPAEVFKRIAVVLLIILAAISADFLITSWQFKNKIIAISCLVIVSVLFYFQSTSWSVEASKFPIRIQDSWPYIKQDELKEQLNKIDKTTPIIYGETDNALFYSLLLDGYNRNIIAYPIIQNTQYLKRLTTSTQPVITLPLFRFLTMPRLAEIEDQQQREIGLYFNAFKNISLARDKNQQFHILRIYIINKDKSFNLQLIADKEEITIPIAENYQGWVDLTNHLNNTKHITINFPDKQRAWLSGIRNKDAQTMWPWDRNIQMLVTPDTGAYPLSKRFVVLFTAKKMLQDYKINLPNNINIDNLRVYSDDSGLLFMK